jgi:MFS family permease
MGMLVGVIMIILPVSADFFALAGLIVAGVGAAPVYPSVIHSTPEHFGKENSHAIVGIQMASAYTGTTLIPPLLGVILDGVGAWIYPFFLLTFVGLILVLTETVNRAVKSK